MFILLYKHNPNRTAPQASTSNEGNRTRKPISDSYLHRILRESGIILKHPPEKCVASDEAMRVVLNLKYNIEKHDDYPSNVVELYKDLERECENYDVFKHYLYPNIVDTNNEPGDYYQSISLMIIILLSIPVIQPKLMEYIFAKYMNNADLHENGPCIQVLLKCLSILEKILLEEDEAVTYVMDLLNSTNDTENKLEIITAIPNILEERDMCKIIPTLQSIVLVDHTLINSIFVFLSQEDSGDEYELNLKNYLRRVMNFS